MASVYISYDNGSNWTEITGGDTWPSSAGIHVVRKPIPVPSTKVRRLRVKITSTDDDTWGIRTIDLRTTPRPQRNNR